MTHLLTVFLVALMGLPVGKVDRGWRDPIEG